jgi:hypothetical protein
MGTGLGCSAIAGPVDEAVVLPAQGVGTAALPAEVEVVALARGGGGMGMVDPAKGLAGLSADPAGLALAEGGAEAWHRYLRKWKRAAAGDPFFLNYSLLLEYQVQRVSTPNIIALVGVEVVVSQGEHFGTVRRKLDKFSTFRRKAGSCEPDLFFCVCFGVGCGSGRAGETKVTRVGSGRCGASAHGLRQQRKA